MADSGSSVAVFVRDAPIAAYIPVCGYTRSICIDHTYTINENGIILVYIYGIHLQHCLKPVTSKQQPVKTPSKAPCVPRSQALIKVASSAERIILVSGTPVLNSAMETC